METASGAEIATSVFPYPSGTQGVLLDPLDHHLARQHPGDYLLALQSTITGAMAAAAASDPRFEACKVIGIGIGATGSSPIPVDATLTPLALHDRWRDHLAAQAWLWKDHTSHEEARLITELARKHRPQYIAKCGGTYSSEWFWSKIWHALRTAPEVFEAAASWVELADFLPGVLCGVKDPRALRRGICAAGHKALYSDQWGGLPDEEFLTLLDPRLAALRSRLYERAWDAATPAGCLDRIWAERLGLPEGIPVAIGELDVHYGSIGSGVKPGVMVKAIGTSSCDCCVAPISEPLPDISGICGIVEGAILPGFYGIEAGQSAVGDLFKWWVEGVCEGDASLHGKLTEEAASLAPGASGLLALDWNNGNRTVLVDPMLSGLLIGQTLHTTRAEIYRALIEASAFGARSILERLGEYGVRIERVVCCGGIAEKNPFLMQLYADITGATMQVAGSGQACALGGAIAAAVLAGPQNGGHPDFATAQAAMTSLKALTYQPDPKSQALYHRLYRLYRELHDAFGGVNSNADLGNVMKELLAIKAEARQSHLASDVTSS